MMSNDEIVVFHMYMESAENKQRARNYEGALTDYTFAKGIGEDAHDDFAIAQAQRGVNFCLEKIENLPVK